MRVYKVGVLGATGAVGQEMIRVLEERHFPVGTLFPLASARSAGKTIEFAGESVPVCEATEASFTGLDFVFGATSATVSRAFAPAIRASGALYIDNASAFRLNDDVPLVVPELNATDALCHHGIIANPNCVTILALTAIGGLSHLSPIRSLRVTTFQAVSGAGAGGMAALEAETRGETDALSPFPYPIAGNLIPQIGAFDEDGWTAEEKKLLYEGRKILHAPSLRVSCTCVRVPILRCHSMAITVETETPIPLSLARQAIASSKGCALVDDPARRRYPMPLDASGRDLVLVGRVRRDLAEETAITLFCCGDQLRKGAALNAVQIAEIFA